MALEHPPAESGGIGRIGAAAVFYFMVVFGVGLILGPVRVLWLEPWLGPTLSVLCEAPFLLVAMWFAAGAAPRWARMRGAWAAHLGVGLIAVLLQQVADLSVGFGLRGMTLKSQLEYFATPAGVIYLLMLIAFAVAPVVRHASRKGDAQ